ncbi:MAG: cation/H(+) antiporter [Novosphingobium sp. 28-62-57]|uniref:cation:proton antiporter n=1 Tax=unclassified Novosphingobium TaxID=2644732 RepID=UPI000BD0F181|nr:MULTISPECIES: cation:proton antiporter [unclassified Novosphingobium]OYW50377.1 MAG: cation/H(+) antiporter [Novosphingobium sp. 12-62-10]OYZ11519.1 MAG: cation/H(+) antiporter [Novosphingobium sp. 28-62-57]
MGTTEIFLIALTIILAVPYLAWRLLRTDYWAPLVVVQIVGGILLGPGVLGAAFPEYYAFVFNPQVIGSLNGIAWWAVMMFVFVAGLELDISDAWANRRETTITASCALITPLLFGAAAAALLLQTPGWIGPDGNFGQVVLGIGMACAVTALPILVLLMEKLGIFREPLGQRILRYASLDDVAIWGVLALILVDWERVGRQVIFLAGFSIASWAVRALFRRLEEGDRWYVSLVWLAVIGFAADWSGLHFMVGAFLAGAVLDAQWFSRERLDSFRQFLLLAVMPVFFLSTGLRTKWDVGGAAVFGAAFLFLAASVAGKLAGVQLAGRLLGWAKGEASIIGWLLQTKALIMIIFVNVLLDKGIVTNETFTALLLMAVLSTMLTVPMVTPRLRRLAGVKVSGPTLH